MSELSCLLEQFKCYTKYVYSSRFPAQHTVQPTKSNLVAVANSGASKGGMMSSRMAGNGSERTNTSGRAAKKNNTVSPLSAGVQCMLL